jgi:polyhydroxybutyrate depolymerase
MKCLRACSALALLAACSGSPPASPALDGGTGDPPDGAPARIDAGSARPPGSLGPDARPATFVVPPAHDGVTPLPLMVLLHGYGASGAIQDTYFGASAAARELGFYLIVPEGTTDTSAKRFWNATPACCDFGATGVDDVAYLTALLDEAESVVPVDTSRVYFFGHSNGGFMSYRMACELGDRVTAIASLAGSDFATATECVPDAPVSVLQVHGTLDATIVYEGNAYYPSARAAVTRWAERAGCDPATSTRLDPLDLESTIPGAETVVERFATGCDSGLDAELWTIEGGGHIPTWTDAWMDSLAGWLLRHSR